MSFRPADHVYIDESKARGYYVVATASGRDNVRASERALRDLLLPGQRRLHFKSESDSRRRRILSAMCRLDVRVSVWTAKHRSDRQARPLALGALVEEAVDVGVAQLIIERDESLESSDRRLIAERLRSAGRLDVRYRHVAPHEHPLLWVSDAVAWCYSHGGEWVRRVDSIVGARVANC